MAGKKQQSNNKAAFEIVVWRFTDLLGRGMNQLPGVMGNVYTLIEVWVTHLCYLLQLDEWYT